MRKNIIVTGPYIPGKSFGGPVKSLLNMVETLSDKYNFHIITGDRDLNAVEPYQDVTVGQWNRVGQANVFYVPKGKELKYIKKILRKVDYDLVYVSSFFAKQSVIIQMLKFLKVIKKPVIVAPRGEFSSGALELKSFKKESFLGLYKMLNIDKRVKYTCSSETDKQDIINVLGDRINISIAGNIVSNTMENKNTRSKKIGKLKIVTVSRIAEIKNIDYSIRLLKELDQMDDRFKEISFDIYGPLEDKDYWAQCLSIYKDVGSRIKVNYKGIVEYDKVVETLSKYHIFLLPSKGENFGHVIQEALLAGCPVLISDQTPWNKLENLNVGYDIELDRQGLFIDALKYYIYMDNNDYQVASTRAVEYGRYKVESQESINEHIEMIDNNIGY